MKTIKKTFLSTFVTLIFLYVGVCIYFYNIQDEIIFRPSTLEQDYSYSYSFQFEERWFETEPGVRIHAIYAKTPADSARGLVIYFHGNRGNNRTNEAKFHLFLDQGYDVLYPDYREYGKSSGDLENEEDLVGDMSLLYQRMLNDYAESSIILLGYSLGSGVAAQVAAANDPAHLVLWAPYYSMVDMKDAMYPFLPDFLIRFPLETDQALQRIQEPVSIFFAGDDEVLPVNRSQRLTQYLKPTDQYFVLEGQGHGWIYRNPVLMNEMRELLNQY